MVEGGGNEVAPFDVPGAGVGVETGAGIAGVAEDADVEATGVAGTPAVEGFGGVLGLADGGAGRGTRGGIEGGGIGADETGDVVGVGSAGGGAEIEG